MQNKGQVFVAYPWGLYDDRDFYKKAYTDLQKALNVKFVFAEERVSSGHVLDKIIDMINGADFGIYDVSGWNANVTLEYGVARGLSAKAYIAFNPEKTDLEDVPSDVKGYDRLQYTSLTELSEKVANVVAQELGTGGKPVDPLEETSDRLLAQIRKTPGKSARQYAEVLGERLDLVQLLLRRNATQLRTTGQTRGMKYFPAEGTD
jgi:hypothetical protein